ncbi:MAG: ATP synthase F1 subunit gamma, partial [Cyclobacteriaceae bacterium]
MANLKEVKNRISSVTSTQQITKAMKMVAAAKLKRAQDKITQMRPYSEKMSRVIQNVTAGIGEGVENQYAQENNSGRVLLVVVTSDRGLCGGFNSSVFKTTHALIAEQYSSELASEDLYIMPIGKKSYEFFKKRNFLLVDKYFGLFSDLTFENGREAAEFAMSEFVEGRFDKVVIIYNQFKNVATQVVQTEQFLPVIQNEINDNTTGNSVDYIFEPSEERIFQEVIPKSLKVQFYKTLLESNASEHGARMTAMDKATENAGDLLKELRLTYNRTRQAAITKEILEIVGGAEALAAD